MILYTLYIFIFNTFLILYTYIYREKYNLGRILKYLVRIHTLFNRSISQEATLINPSSVAKGESYLIARASYRNWCSISVETELSIGLTYKLLKYIDIGHDPVIFNKKTVVSGK